MTRRKQLSSQLMHEVLTAPAQLQAIPPQERKTELQNSVVYSAEPLQSLCARYFASDRVLLHKNNARLFWSFLNSLADMLGHFSAQITTILQTFFGPRILPETFFYCGKGVQGWDTGFF